MPKVLITGASGFIGYHLTKALVSRGEDVTCLVRTVSNVDRIRPLGVELAFGDVTDRASLDKAVAGASVVYHLAGLTKALHRRTLFEVNEEGARNVADACASEANPPVLVNVSSLAAAGPAPSDRPRIESDLARPVSNYGRSKRAGELAVAAYADRAPITTVRPPIVFGEADSMCLETFRPIRRLRIHFVPCFKPRKFSFLHAADLAQLLILAAERGERLAPQKDDEQVGAGAHGNGLQNGAVDGRGCYLGDSGEHLTYHEFGRMIAAALGYRRVLTIPLGGRAIWVAAALSEAVGRLRGKAVNFQLDKAREAVKGPWLASGAKAADELGFAVEADLAERLRQTVRWYRRQHWL